MNNNERRLRILEINEQLYPLFHENFIVSLRYNFLTNRSRDPERKTPSSEEEVTELKELEAKLQNLNTWLSPLFEKLRGLQIRYMVEYDGEVWERDTRKVLRNVKEFYLSTGCEINTNERIPDYNDPEVWKAIDEVKDYILLNEYGRFTIQSIRKL